jgi:hypothetical protein
MATTRRWCAPLAHRVYALIAATAGVWNLLPAERYALQH